MKHQFGLLLSTGVFSLLSACGGGGSGGETFDQLASRGTALIEENGSLTETAVMPGSGTASYQGVAAHSYFYTDPVDIVADPDSLSNVSVTANFGTGTIGGVTNNFRSWDDTPISGSLDITNGNISGNIFTADVSGTLTEGGVNVTYDGGILGGFYGPNAEAIFGIGDTTASVPGLGSAPVTSVFIAAQ